MEINFRVLIKTEHFDSPPDIGVVNKKLIAASDESFKG